MSDQTANQTVETRQWWATALLVGGVIAIICLPLAALGTKLGLWSYKLGIPLMGVGAVLATIVFFLGIIAYVVCVSRKLTAERGAIFIGVGLSIVVLGIALTQFNTARSVPAIHNISTDTANPPQFDKIIAIREAAGADNSLEYDLQKLPGIQQDYYPQVQPLITDVPQGEMVNRVAGVLESMGMDVVNVDASAGIVEASDTTFWFGYTDDVVVRVRAEGSGSVVDVRSVSRVGVSDLGKNASRILEILANLKAM